MTILSNTTPATILFYVHHHGNGHISRAALLLPLLCKHYQVVVLHADYKVENNLCKLHSDLLFEPLASKWTSLGNNRPRKFDSAFEGVEFSSAATARVQSLCNIVERYQPVLFVSDVSAELTIIARSIGIPVLMQRHSGDIQKDPTQVFAYECASKMYAPFPRCVENNDHRFVEKTQYLGFSSRFAQQNVREDQASSSISIVMGNSQRALIIANRLLHYFSSVNVIGCDGVNSEYIFYQGCVDDISQYPMSKTVVCSGGNNIISELLSLGKRLIIVPEDRPYDEQETKALQLESLGMASVLAFDEFTIGCSKKIRVLFSESENWSLPQYNSELIISHEQFAHQFLSIVEELIDES